MDLLNVNNEHEYADCPRNGYSQYGIARCNGGIADKIYDVIQAYERENNGEKSVKSYFFLLWEIAEATASCLLIQSAP